MKTLKVLHLEDNDLDAVLVRQTLKREKIDCSIRRTATEAEFRDALSSDTFDVILADCSLPSFDGMTALALAVSVAPDAPFIFVSGAIGETEAIDSLKAGATDYVLKDNLVRLAPAVHRAIDDGRERTLRKQAEKMDAMGGLAGEIAHDFNNLLGIIQKNAELALHDDRQSPACRGNIEEIVNTIDHGRSLINRLLTYSCRQPVELTSVNINLVVEGSVALIKRLMTSSIVLYLDLECDLYQVEADVSQLEQVIINLAINARDAMPEGGKIHFRTRNVDVDRPSKTRSGALQPGRWAAIDVEDSGIGIPAANMDRIFEPYFSTKSIGEGNGLGLSSVYGIVKRFGGEIDVTSTPGAATSFHIYLPKIHTT